MNNPRTSTADKWMGFLALTALSESQSSDATTTVVLEPVASRPTATHPRKDPKETKHRRHAAATNLAGKITDRPIFYGGGEAIPVTQGPQSSYATPEVAIFAQHLFSYLAIDPTVALSTDGNAIRAALINFARTNRAPDIEETDERRFAKALAYIVSSANRDTQAGERLAARIRKLRSMCEEDDETFRLESLEQFARFWSRAFNLAVPTVTIDEGILRAIWSRGTDNHLAIEFLGDRNLQVVAFTPPKHSGKRVSRIGGTIDETDIHDYIDKLAGAQWPEPSFDVR